MINQIGIICTVHHLWPSRARSVLNFYRQWSLLVLRNRNEMASFMNSREGVTQGGPLSMVAYGIDVLPLIKNLKSEFPDITQTCYAANAGALCTFTNVELNFNLLKRFSLGRGYYHETSKSVLIVHLDNIEAGKKFGLYNWFKSCTSIC